MLMISSISGMGLLLLSLISVKPGLGGECVSGNCHVHAIILPFVTLLKLREMKLYLHR